jgi:hypothetical protein
VRINTDDHHSHVASTLSPMMTAAGKSDFRAIASAPLWSHTAARYAEPAPRSQAKPADRQTVREPARRIPGRYDQGRPPEKKSQSDGAVRVERQFAGHVAWATRIAESGAVVAT